MELSQRKEQFSRAYVHALASMAGFALFDPRVDDDSVDLTFARSGGSGTIRSPRLDAQLKCTEQDVLRADGVHFQLSRKNFDDLRDARVMVPRILIVVLVPRDVEAWIADEPEERLALYRYAWWASLVNEEERPEVNSPTVVLPRANQFNRRSLTDIMDRVGREETV